MKFSDYWASKKWTQRPRDSHWTDCPWPSLERESAFKNCASLFDLTLSVLSHPGFFTVHVIDRHILHTSASAPSATLPAPPAFLPPTPIRQSVAANAHSSGVERFGRIPRERDHRRTSVTSSFPYISASACFSSSSSSSLGVFALIPRSLPSNFHVFDTNCYPRSDVRLIGRPFLD